MYNETKILLTRENNKIFDMENNIIRLTSMVNVNTGLKTQLEDTKKYLKEENEK